MRKALRSIAAMMRCGRLAAGGCVLAVLPPVAAYAQMFSTAPDAGAVVVREIDDPGTGNLWRLVRDPQRPAGPGRMMLAAPSGGEDGGRRAVASRTAPASARPIINAGQEIEIDEQTAVVHARLEAEALEPARQGAAFRARLKMGGALVRAVAVAPGHAVFAPPSEVQP